MNKVILMGRLTKEPELKRTQNGIATMSFTLAVQRNFKSPNGEYEADFVNCVAWRNTAEFIDRYFGKGNKLLAEGRLQVRTYDDKNGQRQWVTEVVVESVEFVESKGSNGGSNSNSTNGNSGNAYAGNSGNNSYPGLGEEVAFTDQELPF